MKSFEQIILEFFSFSDFSFYWYLVFIIGGVLLPGIIVFLLFSINTILAIYFEQKVSAFMQDRLGPMEVGIFGFKGGKKFWGGIGQMIADAVKLLSKEDIIPRDADRKLMVIAPFIIFISAFLTFIGVPLSSHFIISDFNIGIFYILAMSSVVVIGIILAGWASNNKWSLYGAMRSAAQIISYEIPIGLAILIPVLIAGSLHIGDIVDWQANNRWVIIHSPFAFVAFFIYFISGVAEANRAPFDIPEAESELVAGWMTEYSGFRWSLFFLAEYANMLIISLVASIVFLGGWLSPLTLINVFPDSWSYLDGPVWGFFWLIIKAIFLMFIMMWFRWTFPRLRVDQLMYLSWKIFVPFSLANIVFVAIWEILL